MSADLPERLEVTAILDPRPRYRGTSHEDATARAMGFPAALLPGVFVYGHAVRLAVIGWGADWLARGRAQVRFRRPVYAGDRLVVTRGALAREADGVAAPVTVTRGTEGEVVLDGRLGLADRPPDPPTTLPLPPTFMPKRAIRPGDFAPPLQLGSGETVLSPDFVAESRADFHETEAIFVERGLVHPGCLLRRTMEDAVANLALPMPLIFAGAEVENLAPAPVGARYATSSRIVSVSEARGKHYFETEEWLLADGHPVARHVRRNLYAMSRASVS
ncbi:MaoC dehydratase-like protein [Palleronia aestuarii]|uniref:MaoC dehydratase-like protein n=1 Tax=Palleronia aestuarii TaxID=568105 RepID=A0A2W7NJU8_9RHOB|nr:MaoC family dehydratase [Palleronia aestuarii]PZX16974.1 MaoC dehydratase-like protein [Palleronia aestuarii]